jgi:hypothetical protein
MKSNRVIAYLMGCITAAASFLIYMKYVNSLGFPDSFITELERAERRLAYIFIAISVIAGLGFIYLGRIAVRKAIGRKLSAAIFLYIASIVILSFIDYYYHLHLMNSAGG